MKFIYDHSKLRLNKSKIATTRGLFQGSKLSCELFILYMGECMKEVNRKLGEAKIEVPQAIVYVDDIVLIQKTKLLERTFQVTKETFETFGFRMNLKANGTKTALMPFIPKDLIKN